MRQKEAVFGTIFSGHSIASTMRNLREFLRSFESRILQQKICTQITAIFVIILSSIRQNPYVQYIVH